MGMGRVLAVLLLALCVQPAAAAEKVYESWQDPDSASDTGNGGQKALLQDLRELIAQAERDRAASPDFLADLRDLIRRHTDPWPETLLRDDFGDGDYRRDPAWTVLSGEWRVTRNGLTSTTPARAAESSGGGKGSREEMALQLLGALLKQQQGGGDREAEPAPAEVAAITLPRRLPNAVAVDMELAPLEGRGVLEAGLYQDDRRRLGYRLAVRPGGTPALALYRVGASGTVLLAESGDSLEIAAETYHRLRWTRQADGRMSISLDGETVFSPRDRVFSDRWSGLLLRNDGGAMAVGLVRVSGPAGAR